jgi:predicted NAD/FAD-dependent oxidoreductase
VTGTGPVLVVGAGIAGLAAARALAGRGLAVTVVDKGRGVGGRLATRRLGDGASFDHGAALFSPASPEFRRELDRWETEGLVERAGRDGPETFRSRGPATAIAKHLARGLDVRLGAKGIALAREGNGFALALGDGATVRGAAAIVTPPVPQALDLLGRGGLLSALPPGARAALEAVTYRPSFVLLLRLDRRLASISPSGVVHLRDGGPVARVFENAREGGPSRLSVYARGEWAATRFDASPADVAAELRAAAASALGLDPSSIVEEELKRWRYARSATPFTEETLHVDVAGASLLLAGDAFGEPGGGGGRPPLAGNTGLERAFLSGLAAAERLDRSRARG